MEDLDEVKSLFRQAGRPYLSGPWSWLAWSIVLPAAALATPSVLSDGGPLGVLILWSIAVLLGGVVEATQIIRNRGLQSVSTLSVWVLRAQGNLSLIAVVLSVALVWQSVAWLLPGLWLLLLGHSLYTLGGMAFAPLKVSGLLYQIGGLVALWPHQGQMTAVAVTTALANLWAAWSIWRDTSAND